VALDKTFNRHSQYDIDRVLSPLDTVFMTSALIQDESSSNSKEDVKLKNRFRELK